MSSWAWLSLVGAVLAVVLAVANVIFAFRSDGTYLPAILGWTAAAAAWLAVFAGEMERRGE